MHDSADALSHPRVFERALVTGLGRVIPFLRGHDAAPYRDAIVRACTHYTGYDFQVEGTRNTYLFEILQATGEAGAFAAPILAALRAETNRGHASQLFGLALRFAEAGYEEARRAIYRKFDRNDTDELFLGATELIWLDGLNGFLYVAERMGRESPSDELTWMNPEYVLSEAEEQFGKDKVQQALAAAQVDNPALQEFTRAAASGDALQAPPCADRLDLTGATYERVQEVITTHASARLGVPPLSRWGRDASSEDLARAAHDLLAEADGDRLVSYLRIFGTRPFPLEPGGLFPLVHHQSNRVVAAAYSALALLAHPDVRAFALDVLGHTSACGFRRGRAVSLLVRNYERGDEALLARLLGAPRDRWEYHSIGFGALDVLKAHPTANATPALLALYERGPCSNCRLKAVELLHSRGELPDWMLDEARYDSNLDLRDSVTGWAGDREAGGP